MSSGVILKGMLVFAAMMSEYNRVRSYHLKMIGGRGSKLTPHPPSTPAAIRVNACTNETKTYSGPPLSLEVFIISIDIFPI